MIPRIAGLMDDRLMDGKAHRVIKQRVKIDPMKRSLIA